MKKKHLREIQRINEGIPKELLDKLMKKEPAFSTIKEVITRALADATEQTIQVPVVYKWWNFRTWKRFAKPQFKTVWIVDGKIIDKKKYQNILDSGALDKMEDVVDTNVEKQIDEYLNKEFEKARKLGRLPPPQKMPKLKTKSKRIYVQNVKAEDSKEEDK